MFNIEILQSYYYKLNSVINNTYFFITKKIREGSWLL